jgi:enoyl-CoA hydratase/carnithine racemase
MAKFETYREVFANARLTRKPNGVLEVALHTDGGKLVFNGHRHEQFVDLFHVIGEDRDNRVVILTGSGDAFYGRDRAGGLRLLQPARLRQDPARWPQGFSRTSSTSKCR